MQADITVLSSDADPYDLRIDGPDTPTPDDLRRALIRSGLASDLLDAAPSVLRHGDVVAVGGSAAATGGPGLHVVGGIDAGRRITPAAGLSTIGRGTEATHQLDDAELSRIHFTVDVRTRVVTIAEHPVTNRALINGHPFGPPHPLRRGDRIRVGTTVLEWDDAPAVQSAPQPAAGQDHVQFPAPPSGRSRSSWQALVFVLPAVATAFAFGLGSSGRVLIVTLAAPLAMALPLLLSRSPGSTRRARRTYEVDLVTARQALALACDAERIDRLRSDPPPGAIDLTRLPCQAPQVRLGLGQQLARLSVATGSGERTHPTLDEVPICLELEPPGLGLAAPLSIARAQARGLVLQLSVAGVALGLNLDAASEPYWRWARWLPRLRSVTIDARSILAATTNTGPLPAVVVHDSPQPPPAIPGAMVIAVGHQVGHAVSRCADDTGVRQRLTQAGRSEVTFNADAITVDQAETRARELARSQSGAAPNDVHLLDLLCLPAEISADEIESRWSRPPTRVAAPIGSGPGGVVRFDLDADGPHALVGGTTGSGKSQLLQTLVVGLAVQYPPSSVQFLLVDYKGGAAFGPCSTLPHTAGVLTDLDSTLTARALRSLSAELRRRERVLAAAGASDIAEWQAVADGESLPRLLVIVDEFATLATELPDFVSGLVGVAQRGRSLGMHLVLATQRPGGSVSADIRANSNLRIALRTISTAESIDLIDIGDAAGLDPAPGHAIRAGTPPEPFRVAHLGPVRASQSVRVQRLGAWRSSLQADRATDDFDPAQLMSVIAEVAARWATPPPPAPWLPSLPDKLQLTELGHATGGLTLGLVDLPDEQRRDTLTLDLEIGSTTVIGGGARSGRSAALMTAAVAAAKERTPRDLHVHALDYANGGLTELSTMPHLGTLATSAQPTSVAVALIARLHAEATRRQDERAGPPLLLLIDGWAALCAALDAHDLGVSTARLRELLTRCRTAKLTVIVCGDRAVFGSQLAAVADLRIALRCADNADYQLAGLAIRDVPGHLPAGRGLRTADAATVQLAHAPGPWHFTTPRDRSAIRVRELPGTADQASRPSRDGHLCLGLGGDEAEPVWARSDAVLQLLIAGPARSGRSTLLCGLLDQLHEQGHTRRVGVVARPNSPLHAAALELGVTVLSLTDEPTIGPRSVVLIDDAEDLADVPLGHALDLAARGNDISMIVAGAADRLATTFRGPAATAKRWRRGVLLQPSLLDGELLGVRLNRADVGGPVGRGVAIGDPCWTWPHSAGREGLMSIQTWAHR